MDLEVRGPAPVGSGSVAPPPQAGDALPATSSTPGPAPAPAATPDSEGKHKSRSKHKHGSSSKSKHKGSHRGSSSKKRHHHSSKSSRRSSDKGKDKEKDKDKDKDKETPKSSHKSRHKSSHRGHKGHRSHKGSSSPNVPSEDASAGSGKTRTKLEKRVMSAPATPEEAEKRRRRGDDGRLAKSTGTPSRRHKYRSKREVSKADVRPPYPSPSPSLFLGSVCRLCVPPRPDGPPPAQEGPGLGRHHGARRRCSAPHSWGGPHGLVGHGGPERRRGRAPGGRAALLHGGRRARDAAVRRRARHLPAPRRHAHDLRRQARAHRRVLARVAARAAAAGAHVPPRRHVLDVLVARWFADTPASEDEKKKMGVILFLGEWLELAHAELAEQDSRIRLEDFLKRLDERWRSAIVSKIHQVTNRSARPSVYLFDTSKDKGRVLEPGKFGLAELKASDVADQWTLLDMLNFKAIQRREFLAPTPDARPNWERMLRRSAMFSRWVASEIVQQASLTQRVEVMKKFVQVALSFLELHNFNGLMSVWGGLNTTAVHRLTRTKKALPKKTLDIWTTLQAKLSEAQNFGQLRKTVEREVARGEAVVPWFELIVKLRNWADNYSDFITQQAPRGPAPAPTPMLNFGKMYIVGEQLLAFDRHQKALEVVDVTLADEGPAAAVRTYLNHLPCFPDDVLWKYSTLCEPDQSGLTAPGSPGR